MPRLGTFFSLPNQSSAARTFDLWLASVFAFAPTRAWCRPPTAKRVAVQRAGMISIGLSNALAICAIAEPMRPCPGRQIGRALDRLGHVGKGGLEQARFGHWDGIVGVSYVRGIAPDVF